MDQRIVRHLNQLKREKAIADYTITPEGGVYIKPLKAVERIDLHVIAQRRNYTLKDR